MWWANEMMVKQMNENDSQMKGCNGRRDGNDS
jgi:hypothetical protein